MAYSEFTLKVTNAFRTGLLVCIVALIYLLFSVDSNLTGLFGSTLHLASFSILFGTQIWMTFVGAIVLVKSVPLPQFGDAQGAMFPAYFSLNSLMGGLTLTSYVAHHPLPNWQFTNWLQVLCLTSAVAMNCINGFYFGPMSNKIKEKKQRLEREAGMGSKVGTNQEVPPNLLENAAYMRMKKQFASLHGMSQLVNLISIIGCTIYLYHLAQSVHI